MNKKRILLFLLLILIFPKTSFAATANVSCNTNTTVSVGNTVNVEISGSTNGLIKNEGVLFRGLLDYDSSKLEYIGSESRYISTEDHNWKKTYTFKALNEGQAYVAAKDLDVSGNDQYIGPGAKSNNCTINVVAQSSGGGSSSNNSTSTRQNINRPENSDLSEDNSLKSLSIENVKLSPEFNSDTLTYDASLLSDEKTTVVINAETNDAKAKIGGLGEKEVDLGLNKFEIEVEAENGSIRTYTINLTVTEKNPIKIKVNGKKYTLLRKLNGIEEPDDFEKTSLTITDKEVEAFKNVKYKYYLVGLMDKDNNVTLFIYDKGKYIEFINYKTNNLNLVILNEKYDKIPYKYKKVNFVLNNKTVTGYALDTSSEFKVVYALNLDTNEKGLYLYDSKENTFQRFYNKQVDIYVGLIKKCKLAFIIAGGLLLVLFFITICQRISIKKIKKKINNYNINDDLESQLKSEPKKKKKEKKKTFIDE